jgi:hypothetical protein
MKPADAERVTTHWAWVVFLLMAGTAVLGAELAPAQPPVLAAVAVSTNGTGAKIKFATPVYDFGKVAGGEVVKHAFAFTNIGTGLLELKDVRTSCGCTTAGTWTRQVEPGQSGTIPVEFHTGNFSGPVSKPVTVTCNDTNQPVVTLQIKGTIWRPIELIPQTAMLNFLIGSPSNVSSVVRIVNNTEEPLTLSPPESDNRAFAAELTTNQPGKEFQLLVRTVPPLGDRNVYGRIVLKTSSSKMTNLSLPVYAIAQQAVTAIPTQVLLPATPSTNRLTYSVSIRSLWTEPLSVSEPMLNAKEVEVQLKELQPGRYFTVMMTFPAGFEIPQGEKVELSVKSNHPQFPVIKVPVVQLPRPAQAAAPPRPPAPQGPAASTGSAQPRPITQARPPPLPPAVPSR